MSKSEIAADGADDSNDPTEHAEGQPSFLDEDHDASWSANLEAEIHERYPDADTEVVDQCGCGGYVYRVSM